MILLIDGYNVLHFLFRDSKKAFEKKRESLIRVLQDYAQTKTIDIVLVFDGGLAKLPLKEYAGKVTIVSSGKLQSADDWIIEFSHKHKAHEVAVVTRDRALLNQCSSTVQGIDPSAFASFLTSNESLASRSSRASGSIKKYEQDEEEEEYFYSPEELDRLMESSEAEDYYAEESTPSRKSTSEKKPKKERRLHRVLKKL